MVRIPLPERGWGVRLPVPLTSFVGREREVAAVSDLLRRDAVRLVTLTGPGGAGKTRLALRVGEELVPHYADGVVFVSLASVSDAAFVLPGVAQALGVRKARSPALIERLAAALGERQLLLVLDNFEHVVEAGPAVAELLGRCAGLKALMTSRTLLRVSGEQDYPVPPLPVPELGSSPERLAEAAAVRLFAERANAADPAFALTAENAPTVAEICHRLDGLPLALELAAAKVRLLPPAELLVRLDTRLPLLTGGARDGPARLRTMRDAVAWSYDLLGPGQQVLFRRLAVFVGGFELEAAEAVVGRDYARDGDLFSGVEALLEQSLVRRLLAVGAPPRFAMLETVREFGLELLAAGGESEELRAAHAAWYLGLAEQAEQELLGPRPEAWLARLAADHGNLVAALSRFADCGDAVGLARLSGSLGEYWYASGRWAEGRAWLERALAEAANLREPALAKALVAAGCIAHYQGDDARAVPLLEQGRELLRRAGDDWEEAYAQYLLGVAAEDRGDYGTATELLAEAMRRLRAMGDATNAAYAEAHLGTVALGEGDPRQAAAHGEAARALATEAGCRDASAVAVLLLGEAARDSGDLETAASHYGDYLQWATRQRATPEYAHGATEELARLVGSVAVLAAERGEAERAARLLGAAERLREAVGLALALPERAACERASSWARAELGEGLSDRALAAGREMTAGDAAAEIETVLALRPEAPEPVDEATAARAGLSPRETEVLRLIAAGRSNREIAGELFLSVRTVERHVTNLYAKIGARGRATAFALRRGLA